MWGYQRNFRVVFRMYAERVFDIIAPGLKPEVLLVGVREREGTEGTGFPVCIEPEQERWPIELFDDLDRRITEILGVHPLEHMIYGDEPSMARKPRAMREDSVHTAVVERLEVFDREHGTITFCAPPGRVADERVGEYLVLPALAFDRVVFSRFPRLVTDTVGEKFQFPVSKGLLEAVIDVLLSDARKELLFEEPGRALNEQFRRDPTDILRTAGRNLMLRVGGLGDDVLNIHGLFEACSTVASLRHEGAESIGGLVVAPPGHPGVTCNVQFSNPIPLRSPNWTRKILELTSADLYLLSDAVCVYGLGHLENYEPEREDAFLVKFTGFHQWDLCHAGTVLMRTRFGVPGLPEPPFDETRFVENALQIFDTMSEEDAARIWDVVAEAAEQKKGTIVVIVSDPAGEAHRLARQATPIEPQPLSAELVRRLTAIDGAVLLGTDGLCHAIGVILDGEATDAGDPARGARFNSAVRYVSTPGRAALAIVISEDGSFDVLPLRRQRVLRSDVSAALEALRRLSEDQNRRDLPEVREQLERYRFYLSGDQCIEANNLLLALEKAVVADGDLWVVVPKFAPSPEMDDSYFLPGPS